MWRGGGVPGCGSFLIFAGEIWVGDCLLMDLLLDNIRDSAYEYDHKFVDRDIVHVFDFE